MHVIFRESHGLEESEVPTDLRQSPADLVVLSFSDSDLGAFAAGWHRAGGTLPGLRLANLVALKHPLSVDTYVEQTLSGARGILIRLIGGVSYWAYGLAQVQAIARARGIALAVLPADGRPDPRLDAISTVPASTLHLLARLCDTGGAVAAQAALAQLALAAGLYAGPVSGAKSLPEVGFYTPEAGAMCAAIEPVPAQNRVLITFYRAYLTAADLDPVDRLFAALRARGMAPMGLFVPSLKAPDAARWLARWVKVLAPKAIINATAFSGIGAVGPGSPLDAAEVPVFQVALATSTERDWVAAERGLSPTDLAMHVVLPEVDGRLFAGVASFKQPGKADPALQYSRFAHQGQPGRVAAIADRVAGWVRLAGLPETGRRVALVLSTYPGKAHQMAHAVGLDAIASAEAILDDLKAAGYTISAGTEPVSALLTARTGWSLAAYRQALQTLPEALQERLQQAWGPVEDDPLVAGGLFQFPAQRRGNVLIALQPERGDTVQRAGDYHDLNRVPRHSYVAFYLWLRGQVDALVHVGAHGTLEWLPGKSVALSDCCWPEALVGATPVIYPFIVNDPGEAAQAKRRIGALTIGHITPPLRAGGMPAPLARLERLLDEYSTADGLDPKRRDRLIADIRAEAVSAGIETDLGIAPGLSAAEAMPLIDRFVCDVKESQFGDGLHVFGRVSVVPGYDIAASARAESRALLDALAGRRVAAGPSGSPWRGRADVLPTGRNLYTTDPRAVPSRAAFAQGGKLAGELIRRHLQDHGDYPRGLIVDLWGSATMRTAGEEFAMALHLLGVRPVWDDGSDRVTGFEVLPIAMLDRPRIDVTLRVSGLFRDVFPTLTSLFGQAVAALAARDEAPDWNPYVRQAAARVYGPEPGTYGLGMGDAAEDYADGRARAGKAWLTASSWALDQGAAVADPVGIRARVAAADAFVHLQDLPETDLLLAADHAAHQAGFAAAQAVTGGKAALYHLDATRPEAPRARTLAEEIARVVRGRAANPDWAGGMMRHGFRGAAEIAATLDHMAVFAHLAGAVAPHLFDLYHDATLGSDEVRDFLARENPGALAAMQGRFRALHAAGLWATRRNSVLAGLGVGHDAA